MNTPKGEKRRFPRVMAPVYYRMPRFHTSKQRVSNVSLGGVRIHSDERLYPGQRLELEFIFPNGSIIKAIADVIWIKELASGSGAIYDVGLGFIELSAKAQKELQKVLKSYSQY